MNLAEMLFEDIVFSRTTKKVLLIRLIKGWVRLYFKSERIFFRLRMGTTKFSGDFSLKFFLRTLNQFFLKGDLEKICEFLRQINLRKNRWLRIQDRQSIRSNNITKELVMNFLLYRLGYEKRSGMEISLNERYVEKLERGHFYLAQRLFPPIDPDEFSGDSWRDSDEEDVRPEKEMLGGYIFSLVYAFINSPKSLKVHLPHVHIHRLVRDALANLGLKIG